MGKMHTREKRKKGLSTNKSYNQRQQEYNGRKTWRSKEAAKQWAASNDLDSPTIRQRGAKYVIKEQQPTAYRQYQSI